MMISQFGEAHVIEFNSSVVKVYKVKSKFKDISHPSGGTNFDTVVDYIARKKVKCNSLVVFTDGEFEIRTDKPKYDILFCLEPKDTMHDWKYGKIIRMPL
jgi:predicted metal-dependent peptidase